MELSQTLVSGHSGNTGFPWKAEKARQGPVVTRRNAALSTHVPPLTSRKVRGYIRVALNLCLWHFVTIAIEDEFRQKTKRIRYPSEEE